ncbi:TIGR02391 family protein [Enterobacterales bacterium AE_CKDN230030158-1A_HGKHYDSX7]
MDKKIDARLDALNKVLGKIEELSIDASIYFSDLEPQGFYDRHLTALLSTLAACCQYRGWTDLLETVRSFIPSNGNAPEALAVLQGYLIHEVKARIEQQESQGGDESEDGFWGLIHPDLVPLAKPRFERGFRGDAVESVYKAVNKAVKEIVVAFDGRELDGAGLMTTAFSPANPIIRLNDLRTESERNMQQGYMQIFSGAMIGIRNPKAHGNLNPDPIRAKHLIALASLLMYQVAERRQ